MNFNWESYTSRVPMFFKRYQLLKALCASIAVVGLTSSVSVSVASAKGLIVHDWPMHDTKKDHYGLSVEIVAKTPHIVDVNMTNHAYTAMNNIYDFVGSKEVYKLPEYLASHTIGANRMGTDAIDGVVNKWGQAHEVSNFVSDGDQFTYVGLRTKH